MHRATEQHSDQESAEAELVASAAAGSRLSFRTLYDRHSGHVFAVCVRLAGQREVAEDMVQDTFVKAWQNLGSFNHESSFSTWIHRIAVNTALSMIRKRDRRADLEPDRQQQSSTPGTEDRIDLDAAIMNLPDRARQVFVLHDIEGYKHREISDQLGIAPGTSKAHLHTARKQLASSLSR